MPPAAQLPTVHRAKQPVRRTDAPRARKSDAATLTCAAALLLLGVMAEMWAQAHLGIGLDNPGWLAPLAGAAAAVIPQVRKLLRSRERGALARSTARLFRWILRPVPIAVAYLVFAICALTRSSLSVIGAPGEVLAVSVAPADGGKPRPSKTKANPVEFHGLATSPFGRTYRVEVDGYIPAVVKLAPLTGRQLQLGRDFVVSPSILIRPSRMLLGHMADSARLVLYRVRGGQRDSIAGSRDAAAMLVGREQPISFRPEWTWELAEENAARRDSTMLQWVRPTTVSKAGALNPGTRLTAVVLSRHGGAPLVEQTFTVRNERLMDVPLYEGQ
jgi:hypothetical protein